MATVKIAVGQSLAAGAPIEVPPRQNQTMTSNASSQASGISARSGETIKVTTSGGAIHAKIIQSGGSVSTADSHALITDGSTWYCGAAKEGDTVAIIDA